MDKINTEHLSCYTIGHSNHTIEQFAQLLNKHDIDIIIDVRSSPYSKYVPHFNKEELELALNEHDISYLFMGDKLGGRYTNPDLLFSDGSVDYAKVSQTNEFIDGIQCVIEKINDGKTLAVMCSEKNPLDCHRFVLVSHRLEKQGIKVKHILGDGEVVLNDALEEKLIQQYNLEYQQTTLFGPAMTKAEAIEEAYLARNKEIDNSSIKAGVCT